MKNNKLLSSIILMIIVVFSSFAQDRDLITLLEDYKQLSYTVSSESVVLAQNFNAAEQLLLASHFKDLRSNRETSNWNMAMNSNHIFYVFNTRSVGNQEFGTLDGDPPFDTIDIILEPLSEDCFAGEFDDTGTLYAASVQEDPINGGTIVKDLITIDITNGEVTIIGDLSGALGQVNPTGLTYNFITSTMYVSSGQDLFTINLQTAETNYVGSFNSAGGSMIWIEIDNNGNAFGADVVDDMFYSIDLSTGAATPIGPLGIDLSFAQEATVDPETNILYMAGYEGGGVAAIHTIDKTTGAATLVGDTTPLNSEFTIMSIAGVPVLEVSDYLSANSKIYPNPMIDELNIELPSEVIILKKSLYDLLGKKMDIELVSETIDVSGLQQGIYILQLETTAGTLTQKLIKN